MFSAFGINLFTVYLDLSYDSSTGVRVWENL